MKASGEAEVMQGPKERQGQDNHLHGKKSAGTA